jgi:hypothetical protein
MGVVRQYYQRAWNPLRTGQKFAHAGDVISGLLTGAGRVTIGRFSYIQVRTQGMRAADPARFRLTQAIAPDQRCVVDGCRRTMIQSARDHGGVLADRFRGRSPSTLIRCCLPSRALIVLGFERSATEGSPDLQESIDT